MYQRPIAEDSSLDSEAGASPLRGFLIAAPLALGFWAAVVVAAFYLI
jgi:hypothetical protein